MIAEIREELGRDLLVVYRWMPDHLLAATLLAEWKKEKGGEMDVIAFTDASPNLRMAARIAAESRKYDSVLLLGPGWLGSEIDLVATNIMAPVVVVDNSYNYMRPRRPNVLYFNPSPRGDPRGSFPSITFTLATILGEATSLLVAASIAALLGEKSVAVRAYQNAMTANGLHHLRDLDIAMECAMRAVGATEVGDPATMSRIPISIAEASMGDPCKSMLDDALLASLQATLEARLEAEEPERRGRVLVYREAGHPLLCIAAREEAHSSGSTAAAVSGSRFCVWSPGRAPLASRLQMVRASGARAYAVYQGIVNLLAGEAMSPWGTLALLGLGEEQ